MKNLIALLISIISINVHAGNYDVKESTMGYMSRPDGVYFQVYSGGCTRKDDFRVETQNLSGIKQVTIYRIRPDQCYSFVPLGVIISFSHDELGLRSGDRYFIGNGVGVSQVW